MKRKSAPNLTKVPPSVDLSDKTIIVLLLLVVVVSVISVVVYLQVLNTVSAPSSEAVETDVAPAEARGTVTLQIIEPPQPDSSQAPGPVN